jgi:predicted Rossmann fold nucleotide-binding protein DprA/Smf involved in DNA uptake
MANTVSMPVWQHAKGGLCLTGVGCAEFLDAPMTAFFSSRTCPGTAIRAAMAWAITQAKAHQIIVSGFHSTLEQSVLKVLLAAHSPAVPVLARPVLGVTLPPEWSAAITDGQLAVVSASTKNMRLTSAVAMQRNNVVVAMATTIVVAHAEPGGGLSAQCHAWAADHEIQFL